MTDMTRVSITEATSLIRAAIAAAGASDRAARSVAAALAAAEAEGQAGHGFARVEDYAAQVRSGKIDGAARIRVIPRGASSILIDADLGFAYPAIDRALEVGLPAAEATGIAVMAICNSHHCGALSIQVEKIARAGLIGLMVANTPKAMAPWGAREAVFGTNPIAFAAPHAGGDPLVIDLSLSRVARGKVLNASRSGKEIPPGWAFDAGGNPTTDPKAALDGTMAPIGGAKGTALALMVEILAAGFTGAAFSREAGSFFHAEGPPPRVGQTLIAIRPDPDSGYAARVSALLEGIANLPGTRLPGARRARAIAAARAGGIEVPTRYIDAARALGGAA